MNNKLVIDEATYRDKVLACWLGKNIGGTLGAPFEWKRQINNVSFYTQELGGEPLPNDDLDIQLLWLVALEEMGIDLDEHILSEYWCTYVTPHWAEYGTGKINMRSGLVPPLSGLYNNTYKDSCGCFIRSEIWACIAPGLPDVAAEYARMDGYLDHGTGEGTIAEIFCAAMESAAFFINDYLELIDIGLSYIPEDSAVAGAVRLAVETWKQGIGWKEARHLILEEYRGMTTHGILTNTSEEDRGKGFHEGTLGFDVPSNIAIVVRGLLEGGDDFGKGVCTTVNMGEDTDCTGATMASIFGLVHGTEGIPKKWIDPIGYNLRVGTLNLGELGFYGGQLPQDLRELTDRTERIAEQLLLRHKDREVAMITDPTESGRGSGVSGGPDGPGKTLFLNKGTISEDGTRNRFNARFSHPHFTVIVDYGSSPTIASGETKQISVTVENTYKIQTNFTFRWYLPEDLRVEPSSRGTFLSFPKTVGGNATLDFVLCAEEMKEPSVRGAFELTVAGRPTVILVPIMLLQQTGPVNYEELKPH